MMTHNLADTPPSAKLVYKVLEYNGALTQKQIDHDIRPLNKHREFTSLHKAWNPRLDSDLYHQRNMNETVNAAIKQKFGAFVRSRLWWKMFRELVIKCVVYNVRTHYRFESKREKEELPCRGGLIQ